jgi:hypothetical protein
MISNSLSVSIAKSSLPGVRRAVRNERVAEDTMSLWMRNVDSKWRTRYIIILLLAADQ